MFDLKQLLDEYEKEKQRQNLVELPAESLPVAPAPAPEPVVQKPIQRPVASAVNRAPAVVAPAEDIIEPSQPLEEKPGLDKQVILDKILAAYNNDTSAELAKAQESKRDMDLLGALSKAGQRMSAGYASTGGAGMVKSDPTFADNIIASHKPVENLKERQAIELKRIADLTKAYKDINPDQKFSLVANTTTIDNRPLFTKSGDTKFYDEAGKVYSGDVKRPYIEATMGNLQERISQNDRMYDLQEKNLKLKEDANTARETNLNQREDRDRKAWEQKTFKQIESGKAYRTYKDLGAAAQMLESAAKDPNGYKDMAAIFKTMKALDPDSVVRESEYKTASGIGSFPDKVKNMLAKFKTGEQLQPAQRQQMVELAKLMYRIRQEGMMNIVATVDEQAKDYNGADLIRALPRDLHDNYAATRPKPAPQTTTKSGEGMVKVQAPNGAIKLVPQSRVDDLVKNHGGKVVK